jgi:hypothetical protein
VFLKASGLTVLLSTIFVIPFLEQSHAIHISSAQKTNLITNDGLSELLGGTFFNSILHPGIFGFFYTVVLVFLTYLLIKRKLFTKNLKIYGFLTIIFAVLSTTLFPWFLMQEVTNFLNVIQFIWRWFIFAVFFASLYIVEGIFVLARTEKTFKFLKLIPFCLMLNGLNMSLNYSCKLIFDDLHFPGSLELPIIHSSDFLDQTKKAKILCAGTLDYATYEQHGITENDLMMKSPEIFSQQAVVVDGKKTDLKLKHENYVFYVDGLSKQDKTVMLPTTWLKGMQAKDANNRPLPLYQNPDGYPYVENNGSKVVYITYHKTLLHKISILVSGVSWGLLIIGICFLNIKKIMKNAKMKVRV